MGIRSVIGREQLAGAQPIELRPGAKDPQAARPRRSAHRICVVLHDFSGGGSEKVAIRLANRWAELGRRVTLVCGSCEGPLRPMVDPAVTILPTVPPLPRGPRSRSRLARALGAILRAQQFDLLFLPGNYHWPLAEAAGGLPLKRRPVVVAQISNPLRRPERGRLRQAFFEACSWWRLRHAAAAVALHEQARLEAKTILAPERTRALPLPALDDRHAPPTQPPGGAPLIVAIGRLTPQKDFRLAIEAFARVSDPAASLVILGEGPQRAELSALIAKLGLEGRVTLEGYVENVRPWLDRAHLLLATSRFEGYGAMIVEALAAGRPVVATSCGGAVEELLAHPAAGLVARDRDPDTLARAIEAQLARGAADPDLLARLVRRHRLGPVAQTYLETFDAALA